MLAPQIANSIKASFIPPEHPIELKIVTDSRLPIETIDTDVPAVPTIENLPVLPTKSSVFYQCDDTL